MNKDMKKWYIYFVGFFFIAFFMQGSAFCSTLKTDRVRLIKEPVYSYIPAEVISKTAATILSKIPGFVENLRVDIGDRVKKGEILLTIDQNISKQNIKEALANVAKAKAQLKNAKFNYKKYFKLYKNKVISKQQFLNMKTEFKTAVGAYEQAVAGLRAAQSTLRYSVIKSPINGIVSAKYVNNGDIASMFQPLLKINRLNALQVKANIDEKTLSLIHSLKFVKIEIGDKILNIKPSHVSPALDSITRTLEIKADLPKTFRAKPGEFAYVIIETKDRPAIMVNTSAITTRGGINGVFVVGKNGKAYFRVVRLGEKYNGYVEVLSGLFPKETVVLNPPLKLKNDSVVLDEKQ